MNTRPICDFFLLLPVLQSARFSAFLKISDTILEGIQKAWEHQKMMSGIDLQSVRSLAQSSAYAAVEAETLGDRLTAADQYEEAANHLGIVLESGESRSHAMLVQQVKAVNIGL